MNGDNRLADGVQRMDTESGTKGEPWPRPRCCTLSATGDRVPATDHGNPSRSDERSLTFQLPPYGAARDNYIHYQ